LGSELYEMGMLHENGPTSSLYIFSGPEYRYLVKVPVNVTRTLEVSCLMSRREEVKTAASKTRTGEADLQGRGGII